MIGFVLQWLAVMVVGGLSGGVIAALVMRARLRRVDTVDAYEVDDAQIDSMANEWAESTGRPWAARSVAEKLRLLVRIDRSRAMRRRS